MSIPEKVPSPNQISELGTVEEWRQITNQIVRRLNSLYNGVESTADLKVGGSIYSGDLSTSFSYILINNDSGKIINSDINIEDLKPLLDGNFNDLTSTGIVKITDGTNSTSCEPLTGSLQVSGGVSIAKNLYVCGGIYGEFIGDGSQLINLPVDEVWVIKNQNDIYYGLGKVGIGDFSNDNISSDIHLKKDSGGGSIKIQTKDMSNTSVEFSNLNYTSKIYLSSSSLKMTSGSYDYISGDSSTGKVTLSKGLISVNGNTTDIINDVTGKYSIAMGDSTKATGDYSIAIGYTTKATGNTSTAMGHYTTAEGALSTAMGDNTLASGENSTAMGHYTKATGKYSTAMGHYSEANGILSTAMGSDMKIGRAHV